MCGHTLGQCRCMEEHKAVRRVNFICEVCRVAELVADLKNDPKATPAPKAKPSIVDLVVCPRGNVSTSDLRVVEPIGESALFKFLRSFPERGRRGSAGAKE